jgi:hypothetical protein
MMMGSACKAALQYGHGLLLLLPLLLAYCYA